MFLLRTLSGRLLTLTVVIVMAAEVFVFLPSVARFREDYLAQRLQMAQIASLALLAADDEMVEETLERELLDNAEVSSIVIRRDFARQLILEAPEGAEVTETYDLRGVDAMTLIGEALLTLARVEPRTIRVIGAPMRADGEVIEITMAEAPLRRAMIAYGERIFLLSLFISATTGVLVFFACRRLIVRPIQRVVNNMVSFQKAPEHAPLAAPGGSGLAEIARAETALADMQTEVRSALRQKSRLADLGAAVAKISHDLRNMLASAQLLADRLEASSDPIVARIGPKLIGSLDRAVALCVSTLNHGKAEEAPPAPRRIALRRLVDDVGDAVFVGGAEGGGAVSFVNEIDHDLAATADPDHLFRVLINLARNARQAMDAAGRAGRVFVRAEKSAEHVVLTVADNGPGMPVKALDNLFQPFLGGARRDGAGLGLAIAAELTALNEGSLELIDSTTEGTSFRLTLKK